MDGVKILAKLETTLKARREIPGGKRIATSCRLERSERSQARWKEVWLGSDLPA
jgi:hypothetical protein